MIGKRLKEGRKSLDQFPATKNTLLLDAAFGKDVSRAPVWMMRQAGRYLPEFMEVRKNYDFFAMCQTPEVASEITLQPLERFKTLDAVIIFSDILVIPQAMGMDCQMVPEKGPVFSDPIKEPKDLDRLDFNPDLEMTLGYVFDAINLTRYKLDGRVPLIGFAGAPFTLMCYMVESGGSKTLSKTKTWLLRHKEESMRLLQGLTDIIIKYLLEQVKAGAQLLQVFESNAGDLSPDMFNEFCLPYLRKIASAVKRELEVLHVQNEFLPVVPITIFARGANFEGSLESLCASDYDVLGVDWTISPSVARKRVKNKTLQGNLDPCILFAEPEVIEEEVSKMIIGFGVERYIANLGHGMMPDHKPENAETFILNVQKISKALKNTHAVM